MNSWWRKTKSSLSDVSSGTHHVINPSRPSPRFSYCKRHKLGMETWERGYVSCLQELYQLKKVWVPYYTLYVHCTCLVHALYVYCTFTCIVHALHMHCLQSGDNTVQTNLVGEAWKSWLHQLHHLPQVALHTVNRREANQLKQCKPIWLPW